MEELTSYNICQLCQKERNEKSKLVIEIWTATKGKQLRKFNFCSDFHLDKFLEEHGFTPIQP